ncbi:hypothetical protein [Sphingobium fuliginis]|uniref:hypothetical protein n=1 Tax=Sphingobium fuliginis (strain ATCC 27551) TaxID=336203 RepID=UPI00046EBF78|nr:hypothetical protein [Sphingobium fuliginis]
MAVDQDEGAVGVQPAQVGIIAAIGEGARRRRVLAGAEGGRSCSTEPMLIAARFCTCSAPITEMGVGALKPSRTMREPETTMSASTGGSDGAGGEDGAGIGEPAGAASGGSEAPSAGAAAPCCCAKDGPGGAMAAKAIPESRASLVDATRMSSLPIARVTQVCRSVRRSGS